MAAEMSGLILEKYSSDARVQEHRRGELYDDSDLIWRIQEIILSGADEARKNQLSTAALKLHDIYVSGYGPSWERICSCDISDVKTIFVGNPSDVITKWPTFCGVENIELWIVDLCSCEDFNIHMNQLSRLELVNVGLSREQLLSLCGSLKSGVNLTDVNMFNITCKTVAGRNAGAAMETLYVRDAGEIQLDFSGHKKLEKLVLWGLDVGVVKSVVLNRDMKDLREVVLAGFCLQAEVLAEMMESLPGRGEKIELGGGVWRGEAQPLRVMGASAGQLMRDIRSKMRVDVYGDVRGGDPCVVNKFVFYNERR